MKTVSIHPFTRLKLFFSFISKRNNRTVTSSKKLNAGEFQRKAHIGNYFAGPHCVFDPRLID